jgi:hypothetical protein
LYAIEKFINKNDFLANADYSAEINIFFIEELTRRFNIKYKFMKRCPTLALALLALLLFIAQTTST